MFCHFITKIISMSLMSGCAILVTIIFKKLLSHKLSPKAHLYIWLPVIAHLVVPHSFSSKMSIYNHVPESVVALTDFTIQPADTISTVVSGIPANSFQINVLFHLWITGAIISFAIPLISYFRFKLTLVSSRQDKTEAELISGKCASLCGIKKAPSLLICKNNVSPMILGIIKPTLVIPSFVLENFTASQIKIIFTHEYVHLKRKDRFANLVLLLVSTIHWFNPLVWIMCRYIRQDMENVCDEETMSALDGNCRKIYGQTLVDLLEKNTLHFVNSMSSTMAYTGKTLKTRIINLCNFGKKRLEIIALPMAIIISTTFLTGAVAEKANDTANLISDNITDIANEIIPSYQSDYTYESAELQNEISMETTNPENSAVSIKQAQEEMKHTNRDTASNAQNEYNHTQNDADYNRQAVDGIEQSGIALTQQDTNHPVTSENANNFNNTEKQAETNSDSPQSSRSEQNSTVPPLLSDNKQNTDKKTENTSNKSESADNSPSKIYTYSSDNSTGVFSSDKEKSTFTADNGHIKIETIGLISSSDSNMSGYFNVYRDGELVGESVRANVSASPNSINFNQTVGSEHDYSFSVDSKTIK